jgi:transposase-like protein
MGSEIIEVVERRRWPVEVRLRILDEVLQPGASIAAVADRNGVSRGLVYQWLGQVREGRMRGLTLKPEAAPTFATVRVSAKACGAQASGNGRLPVEQPRQMTQSRDRLANARRDVCCTLRTSRHQVFVDRHELRERAARVHEPHSPMRLYARATSLSLAI